MSTALTQGRLPPPRQLRLHYHLRRTGAPREAERWRLTLQDVGGAPERERRRLHTADALGVRGQSYRAEESCTNSRAENYNSSIDNSSGNGIIKPITIEDFPKNSSSDQISKECKETIINTLIGQDVSYVYDEIIIINIPRDNKCRIEPMRTNAISMAGYPNITIHTLKKLFFRVTAVWFLRQNVWFLCFWEHKYRNATAIWI